MQYKFYHNLKGDKMLKYLSYLSVQQENSSFCYRLEMALAKAYLMWKRGKYDWKLIDGILEKGSLQLEDPQERLFVETVNTPIGSYSLTQFCLHYRMFPYKGKQLVVLGLIHILYIYLLFLNAKLLIICAAILHGKIFISKM